MYWFYRGIVTLFLLPAFCIQQPQNQPESLVSGKSLWAKNGKISVEVIAWLSISPKPWFLCLPMQVTRRLCMNKNRRSTLTGNKSTLHHEDFLIHKPVICQALALCSNGKLAKPWINHSPTALGKNKWEKCPF